MVLCSLVCNFIVKKDDNLRISLTASFSSHVDSTFLADGDYQIFPESEKEVSEDAGNIVGESVEAPNPSSKEIINISDPSPASEGKPWT
jgi:hypothetical protein